MGLFAISGILHGRDGFIEALFPAVTSGYPRWLPVGGTETRKAPQARELLESSFGYGKSITGVITTSQCSYSGKALIEGHQKINQESFSIASHLI